MYFKAFQLFSPPLLVTLMNLKGFLKHVLCGCIFKQEKERARFPALRAWGGWRATSQGALQTGIHQTPALSVAAAAPQAVKLFNVHCSQPCHPNRVFYCFSSCT